MKRNELDGAFRGRDIPPRDLGGPARGSPRLGEATIIVAVCLGSTILLIGIGLFFRLVTGLSVIP